MTVDDQQDQEGHEGFLDEIERVRVYRASNGHPPPLYSWSGPSLSEWFRLHEDEPAVLDQLLEVFDVQDIDARAALVLLLVNSAQRTGGGPTVAQTLRCQAVARQALDAVEISEVQTVTALRWELAASAWAGHLKRVLEIGARLHGVETGSREMARIYGLTLYRCLSVPWVWDELSALQEADPKMLRNIQDVPPPQGRMGREPVFTAASWAEWRRRRADRDNIPERPDFDRHLSRVRPLNDVVDYDLMLFHGVGDGADIWTGLSINEARACRQQMAIALREWCRTADLTDPGDALLRPWADAAVASALGSSALWSEAAEMYLKTAAMPATADEALTQARRRHCYEAAVHCFEKGDSYAGARRAAEGWREFDPASPEAWKALAKACHKLGDVVEATEAYEKYVLHARESPDEEWVNSLLIDLSTRRAGMPLHVLLERVPELGVTEAVVCLDWPEFSSLAPETRERWLWAVILLSSPHFDGATGELRWASAAAAAGEAVASQLSCALLKPFSAWAVQRELLDTKQVQSAEKDLVHALKNNSVTMGKAVKLLEMAKNQSGAIGPRLRSWLQSSCSGLLFILETNHLHELNQLVPVRNEGVHGLMSAITQQQARDVYASARRLLIEISKALKPSEG